MISADYFCVSIPFIPDDLVGCLNQVVFLFILVGFLIIVVGSKKYRYMYEWFDKKFGDWF